MADEFERVHAWLDVFDVLGFSSRIGHAKPSRQAFEWCIERFDVPPGDILFIDDTQANLDAGGRAGPAYAPVHRLTCGAARLGQPAS